MVTDLADLSSLYIVGNLLTSCFLLSINYRNLFLLIAKLNLAAISYIFSTIIKVDFMYIRNISQAFIFFAFAIMFPTAAFSEAINYSTGDITNNDKYIIKTDHVLLEQNLEDIKSEAELFPNALSNEIVVGNNYPARLQNELSLDSCIFNSNSVASTTQEKQASETAKSKSEVIVKYDSDCNIMATAYPLESSSFIEQANPKIALSQSASSQLPKVPIGFSKLILESPTSPAARLIGSDKTIKSISTSAALAAQLLNGLNSDGDFQTGVAIDFLPYSLIRGDSLTLEDYRKSWFQRFFANTKLSIATVPAPGSTARAALGVEFMLVNDSDPRIDTEYQKKINEISESIPIPAKFKICTPSSCPSKTERPELIKFIQEKIVPYVEEAQKDAKRRLEQKNVWVVGLGQSWVSPTRSYQNLQGEGMGFWTTYKQGLGGNSKLLVHASIRNGERTKQSDGNFVNLDTIIAGVRLQSGDDNFRFSLETAYNRENQGINRINDYLSFGIGLEPRIADNTFLAVSFGGSTGRQNGADLQFTTGLKWNFNPGSAND